MSDTVLDEGARQPGRSAYLLAEVLKAATLPQLWLSVAGGLAAALVVTAASVAAARSPSGAVVEHGYVELALSSVRFSQLGTILVGIVLASGEYEGSQIATTLGVMPRRRHLYGAKTGAYLLLSLALAAGQIAVGLVTARLMGPSGSAAGPVDPMGTSLVTPVLAALSYLVLVGLLGFALGIQVRNAVGAVTSMLALMAVSLVLQRSVPVARFLPTNAGSALYSLPAEGATMVRSGLVVAGWAAVAWAATAWRFVTGDL